MLAMPCGDPKNGDVGNQAHADTIKGFPSRDSRVMLA